MRQNKNRIRWAPALIAAIAATALVPAASQAATGGASSFGGFGSSGGDSGGVFTGWKTSKASWYGPGLYGRSTACGQTLRPKTIGVAHRSLPCGTRVKFRYRGRVVIARVIDRGPYVRGLAWDLTEAASERLNFESVGVDRVRYAIPKKVARKLRSANGNG